MWDQGAHWDLIIPTPQLEYQSRAGLRSQCFCLLFHLSCCACFRWEGFLGPQRYFISSKIPFNLRPSREITWVDFGGWFQVLGCVDEKRLWATGGIKWIKLELHKSPSRTTANASVLEWRHPSSVNSNPVNSLHYSFYLLECRKKTPWWNHSNRFFFFLISHTQFVVLKCRRSCVILSS